MYTDKVCIAIANSLLFNNTLKMLELSGYGITNKTAEKFIEVFQTNNICKVKLWDTNIDSGMIENIKNHNLDKRIIVKLSSIKVEDMTIILKDVEPTTKEINSVLHNSVFVYFINRKKTLQYTIKLNNRYFKGSINAESLNIENYGTTNFHDFYIPMEERIKDSCQQISDKIKETISLNEKRGKTDLLFITTKDESFGYCRIQSFNEFISYKYQKEGKVESSEFDKMYKLVYSLRGKYNFSLLLTRLRWLTCHPEDVKFYEVFVKSVNERFFYPYKDEKDRLEKSFNKNSFLKQFSLF